MGHRRHPDALLDAVALPLPAGRSSPTSSSRGERRNAAGTSASTSCATPGSSTTTGSSTSSSPTPRPAPTTSVIDDHRDQPRARTRRRCTCCRRSGSATPGRGAGTTGPHAHACTGPTLTSDRASRAGRPRRPRATLGRLRTSPPRARPDGAASATTRRTRSSCSGRCRTGRRTPRTASTAGVVHGRHARRSTRRAPAPRRPSGTTVGRGGAGRDGRRCGCGCRRRPPDDRPFGPGFDAVVERPQARGRRVLRPRSSTPGVAAEDRHIARRAYAGLLWSKQLYRYDVDEWLEATRTPRPRRRSGWRPSPTAGTPAWRNSPLADVISMPDEWEYPWFAAWDLAFHAIPLAHVDPAFAKEQLLLMCREWAMHPNGQLPAYEWEFGDVNPPVHAWAAWQVYRIDGYRDRDFLIRVFTKLLLNFSWWVNRKDADGSNLFEGGFLGMDNIGRVQPVGVAAAGLPAGAVRRHQLDGVLLPADVQDRAGAVPARPGLGRHGHQVPRALPVDRRGDERRSGRTAVSLWHDEDGFFYDVLVGPDGEAEHDAGAVDGRAAAAAGRRRAARRGSPTS